MTIKKARKAAGIPLERSRVGDCVYLSATPGSPDGPDLRFHGGKLRHVTVGAPATPPSAASRSATARARCGGCTSG